MIFHLLLLLLFVFLLFFLWGTVGEGTGVFVGGEVCDAHLSK